MPTLYELTESAKMMRDLIEQAEDDEAILSVINEAMDLNGAELDQKIEQCCFVLAEISGDCEKIKSQEERLAARRKSMERNMSSLKARMMEAMGAQNTKKIKTALFSVTRSATAGSVEIADERAVPAEFLVHPPARIDKKAIAAELKAGTVLPFATLRKSESLRIK